jgi:hypothetical protein
MSRSLGLVGVCRLIESRRRTSVEQKRTEKMLNAKYTSIQRKFGEKKMRRNTQNRQTYTRRRTAKMARETSEKRGATKVAEDENPK